ncbi:MAG TPA: DUF4215 domain-containing protein [Polyangiaceae bacterium]|jgi:cysteine-rich repeat protein|nr:DUF4215 domain-containing protein [Polyangiaceae bacterium]
MRVAMLLAIVLAAGCELIGDFSHLRIRDDGTGEGGCAAIDCVALGLTCGNVASACGMQVMNCNTGEKDGEETDIDCGGRIDRCPTRCEAGRMCARAEDCESGVCLAGLCQAPICGDGVQNGSESCEDGNTLSYDGCSATCMAEEGHLLISEVVFDEDVAEYVEIHNPNDWSVSLDDHFLADYANYYLYTTGVLPVSPQVLLGFPPDSIIDPRGFVVVSLENANSFEMVYGTLPDYDMVGAMVPAMEGGDQAGKIGNDTAMIMLFRWDGASDLVTDVDYLLYGTIASAADKSGVTVGSSSYLDDTAPRMQSPAPKVGKNVALYRCDTAEETEVDSGGNGVDGHDETSEQSSEAFAKATEPTPGMAPVDADRGPCR